MLSSRCSSCWISSKSSLLFFRYVLNTVIILCCSSMKSSSSLFVDCWFLKSSNSIKKIDNSSSKLSRLLISTSKSTPTSSSLLLASSSSTATATATFDEKSLFEYAEIVRNKIQTTNLPYNEPTSIQYDYVTALSYLSMYETKLSSSLSTGLFSNKKKKSQESSYERGFCNWIIPNYLMVGQYPGMSPESSGPNEEDVGNHIRSITTTTNDGSGGSRCRSINVFVSLQAEIPSQNDYEIWQEQNKGAIYFDDFATRQQFPGPFMHYAPIVNKIIATTTDDDNDNNDDDTDRLSSVLFIHAPIEDLNVPDSKPLQELLLQLLQIMASEEDNAIYMHCWGGRGRAGIVSGCLLSLIWPQLTPDEILNWIQAGYDTRAGASEMPMELSKSPQTMQQRQFVKTFVNEFVQKKRQNK